MSDVVEVERKDSQAENIHNTLPGQKLKKARENRNLEQVDIAKELKLDLRFVKALEEERFSELPQPVYTAGYVRAYSKLVGLVPDEIVSEYSSHQKASVRTKPETEEKEQIPSHYRHVQTSLPKSFSVGHGQDSEKRKLNVLISILAVVVVFAIVWQVSDKPADKPVPEALMQGDANQLLENPANTKTSDSIVVPAELPPQVISPEKQSTIKLPLPEVGSQSAETATETADIQVSNQLTENAQKITELSLHYSEDSWVDIRDATGKAIIRKLGMAGKSNTVSGVAPFEVLLGYSPGVSIEYNGKPYDLSAYSDKRVARFVLNSDGGVERSPAGAADIDLIRSRRERSEPFVSVE